ncbi:MAG TPA: translation initiation factor IF-2 [Gemmatimonadaceae bacterium]|nr:translation initiation factor IF-2 [Gemmatimonadaceae bacterium]
MSKLRVNEMATEFGITADEVLTLLRQMEVPARSQTSALTDDQVARLRARWEREKRVRAEKAAAPAAPPAAKKRRVAAKKAAEPEEPVPVEAAATPAVRRRKRADLPPAEVEVEIEQPAPVAEAPAPAPRAVEAPTPAAAAPAPATVPRPEPVRPAPVAPRAPAEVPAEALRAAQPEAPAAPAPRPVAPPAPAAPRPAAPEALPPRAAEPPRERPAMPQPVASASPRTQQPLTPPGGVAMPPRPRPVTPGAPRPRSVTAGGPLPPRPVASATPGGRPHERPAGAGVGGGGGAGGAGAGTMDRGRGRKKGKRGAVDREAVDANISKTMAAMRSTGGTRRSTGDMRREAREEQRAEQLEAAEREKRTVRVNEFITVSELAQTLKISATEIVGFAFKNLGLMVTINQRLDFDQIELIAGEFGFQAVREEEYLADVAPEETEAEEEEGNTVPRPPIVTIMGHVDHGKTSLLDYVRKATVVAGEAGGITQHIGAYHVSLPKRGDITFLDTPGHEAFTAMRARGAQVTDIVILVVAADDAVMPQTIEAISHARNAGVPMIVAINKIDLPTANPGKVKQDLLQHGVVLEEFGGEVLSQEVSAKKGLNVDKLLETVALQAEILDLKANPDRAARGTVVEAQLDPGKGPVATVLVQNGTLKVGDHFICGMFSGRIRALLDERGKQIKSAGPAIPAQILGIEGVPMAGDQLIVAEDAASARDLAQRRQRLDREAKSRRTSRTGVSLEDFMKESAAGQMRTLNIIIKADQGGPSEALADALDKLSTNEVEVSVVHRGVGAITESDILLAKTSGAVIIGFHVRPDNNARAAAEREGVDVKLYRVIYDAVNDVRAALEGLLRPVQREVILGEAEVRETFKVPRIGTVAGCAVRSGIIRRDARVRLVRDGVEIFDGTIGSLRRFKEDVKEVREGFECGIGIENFNDVKVGDVIECYKTEEVARTLDGAAS